MNEFVPLIGSQTDRGIDANVAAAPTKDQLFQNCLFYPVENAWTGKKTIFVEKRPGVPASGTTDTNFAVIDGFYYWKQVGTMVRYGYDSSGPGVVARYASTDSAGTSTSQQIGNSRRVSHVSEGKDSTGTACLFLVSSGSIANTYTTIYMMPDLAVSDTHITVPSGSCGHPVYMDGYLFVANTDGRIYNSALNDPTTGYTDFIGVDIYPGVLVSVFKHKNYLCAFKTHSMELFRIGEQTTGSPLQRIPEFSHKIGLFKDVTSGTTWSSLPIGAPPVVFGNNSIFWLGQGEDGLGVYQMENTEPKKISNPIQDKYLTKYGGYFKYLVVGKRRLLLIYCTYEWLCYDIDLGVWSVWVSATSSTLFKTWENTFNGEGLISANSNIYYNWTPTTTVPYLDIADNITRKIRTSIIDGDTNDYKDFTSVALIGDQQTTTSNITVKWTKDDYQTWNTGRTIDMSSANPKTHALGVARRIAFELTETNQNAGRLRGLELDYNIRR